MGPKRRFFWEVVVPDLVSCLCLLGVVALHGLGSWEHPSGMWPPTRPRLNPGVWRTSVGVFDHQTHLLHRRDPALDGPETGIQSKRTPSPFPENLE